MTAAHIESLTASLVREYLSRKDPSSSDGSPATGVVTNSDADTPVINSDPDTPVIPDDVGEDSLMTQDVSTDNGLKSTLQILDEEFPRMEGSISNRQLLVKELHIEKLMKKNKEQSKPWKAMMEVITQFFVEERLKSGARNGVMATEYPQPPARSMVSSTHTYGPRSSTVTQAVDTKLNNEVTFDGFPAPQQNDDDDLLKPDPNFTYPQQRLKPRATKVTVKAPGKQNANDLVIEDSQEGETTLGHGRAGVIQLGETEGQDESPRQQSSTRPRPRSGQKPRGMGMVGPITSTEESSRRKFHKPVTGPTGRPMSSGKQRLNLFDNSTIKFSSLETTDPESPKSTPTVVVRPQSHPIRSQKDYSENSVRQIETLLSNSQKTSIKDVLELEPERQNTGTVRRQTSLEKEAQHYSVDTSSIGNSEKRNSRGNTQMAGSQSSSTSSVSNVKVSDMEMGDVDDLDADLAKLDLAPRITSAKPIKTSHNSKAIDVKTIVALKTVIFGTPMQNFNDEWRFQSYSFCDMPKLKYGIVQKKGGACGVLASVQAFILQELLFSDQKLPTSKFSDPSHEERSCALATTLAKVFWRAGEKRKAVVALPSGKTFVPAAGRFKSDKFIETLSLYTFVDFEELHTFMKQAISQFELDGLGGVVLSLYSAILSRKIESLKEDMDEPGNKLMGAHGYCTQEMVNLYISGRAVSNVFNDVMELDSGDGNIMILKGVVSRCDVGLMSLFEHYKSCQVGTYLKTPRFPIWVVCSESHFSVLFCPRRELTSDWKAEKRFDLYYYDGLARQQEEIKLTINTNNRDYVPPSEDELVPPLEHCIRTKWEGSEVNWNGTEPLL